jgi:hypothetical protein
MAVSRKELVSALETHIDRLKHELAEVEEGEVRFGTRKGKGAWQDQTEDVIHDKRNLIATFSALLRAVSSS